MVPTKELKSAAFIKKTVNAFKCLRCNWEWIPKVTMKELETGIKTLPRICPHCKSAYWDRERKNKKKIIS